MDSSFSSSQGSSTAVSETSSPAFLLERGIHCTRQGCYVEGAIYFAHARERLSPDQMHFAATLDGFIQIHTRYLQAQQALHMASKHFVEVDTEQQTQLVALEKLLLALREETDRAAQPHTIAQPPKNSWGHQSLQSPQLPPTDPTIEQSSQLPHSLLEDDDALPALYITCFGRFEVRRLSKPIALCSSRKGQSILRYLVAQSGHCATSDTLMTLLWPEDEPEVAQPRLHTAICALRRSLNTGYTSEPGGGYIVCKNRMYCLNSTIPIQTDVDQFLHYYQAGRQTNEERVALYEKACRLYTGPFLPEDKYADWSFLQREHLSRVYIEMCKTLTDHYLKVKSYEDAERWATALLKENHCDEAAHRQLIQVYAAQGRRSEALQQFQRCEYLLREELGVTPLPETIHLFQKLLLSETSSTDAAKI